jgi:chitinase
VTILGSPFTSDGAASNGAVSERPLSADGSCFTYTMKQDDGCWAIGDSFGIDAARIENNNKKTFGFAGCDRLQIGQVICLKKGNLSMPAQNPTALCGPWVVGRTDDISEG